MIRVNVCACFFACISDFGLCMCFLWPCENFQLSTLIRTMNERLFFVFRLWIQFFILILADKMNERDELKEKKNNRILLTQRIHICLFYHTWTICPFMNARFNNIHIFGWQREWVHGVERSDSLDSKQIIHNAITWTIRSASAYPLKNKKNISCHNFTWFALPQVPKSTFPE